MGERTCRRLQVATRGGVGACILLFEISRDLNFAPSHALPTKTQTMYSRMVSSLKEGCTRGREAQDLLSLCLLIIQKMGIYASGPCYAPQAETLQFGGLVVAGPLRLHAGRD